MIPIKTEYVKKSSPKRFITVAARIYSFVKTLMIYYPRVLKKTENECPNVVA